eukprot:517807-Pleurochrysis_carterae.AAC.3
MTQARRCARGGSAAARAPPPPAASPRASPPTRGRRATPPRAETPTAAPSGKARWGVGAEAKRVRTSALAVKDERATSHGCARAVALSPRSCRSKCFLAGKQVSGHSARG